MTPEVWDLKNCIKTTKMWNHSELVENMGGHKYPSRSRSLRVMRSIKDIIEMHCKVECMEVNMLKSSMLFNELEEEVKKSSYNLFYHVSSSA
jgi:hypothetical protein